MRKPTALWVGAAMVLALTVVSQMGSDGRAQPTPSTGTSSSLLAVGAMAADRHQQIAVIDPQQHVLAVYHVGLHDGKIELKGVRDIRWDLQLEEFGNRGLAPKDIRGLIDQE